MAGVIRTSGAAPDVVEAGRAAVANIRFVGQGVAPKGAIGFAAGLGETALTGMRGGGGHAIRKMQGVLVPNSGSLASRVEAFKSIAVPILERPLHTANSRVGATQGRAFLGKAGGRDVAIVVAKEGPHQGKVITSFFPDGNQLNLFHGR